MSFPIYYSKNDFFSVSAIDIDSNTSCDCSKNNNIITCFPTNINELLKDANSKLVEASDKSLKANKDLAAVTTIAQSLNTQIKSTSRSLQSAKQTNTIKKQNYDNANTDVTIATGIYKKAYSAAERNKCFKSRLNRGYSQLLNDYYKASTNLSIAQEKYKKALNEYQTVSNSYAGTAQETAQLTRQSSSINDQTTAKAAAAYYASKDYEAAKTNRDTIQGQFDAASKSCTSGAKNAQKNIDLNDQFKKADSMNDTTLGLYNDSGLFYNTQYIQLWNLGGGIAIAGYMIYYLIRNSVQKQNDITNLKK